MAEFSSETSEHINKSVELLTEMGLVEKAGEFPTLCQQALEAEPIERADGETDTELDKVLRVENQIATEYKDGCVELIEKKRAQSARSAFSQLTLLDKIADCCYQRGIRVLFADPGKPNRIIFERFERKDDGLEVYAELDKYMKNMPGYDISQAQETRSWPIISACLEQLGFSPAWGRSPQKPWEGGGRSAAEGAKTSAAKKAGGGMKN